VPCGAQVGQHLPVQPMRAPGTRASRSSISAFTLIAQPANAGRPIMGPIHEPTTEGASTYAWRLRLPGRVFRTRGGQWECRVAVTGSIRFYIRRGVIRSQSMAQASGCRHRGVGAPARRSVLWPTTIERRGDQRFEDGGPAGGQDRRAVKPGSTPRLQVASRLMCLAYRGSIGVGGSIRRPAG